MNKIDKFLSACDTRLDLVTNRFSNRLDRKFFYISVGFFIMLGVLSVSKEIYNKPRFIAGVMSQDVQNLAAMLGEINERCFIKAVSHARIKLDFLATEQFSGSGLTLAHPERWEGPYVSATPRIQGKAYELVKTTEGLFVVPGEGVRLPNGSRMGRQVKITPNTRITAMIKQGGKLFFNGDALAAQVGVQALPRTAGVRAVISPDEKKVTDKSYKQANDMLKEVADALPFAEASYPGDVIEF